MLMKPFNNPLGLYEKEKVVMQHLILTICITKYCTKPHWQNKLTIISDLVLGVSVNSNHGGFWRCYLTPFE